MNRMTGVTGLDGEVTTYTYDAAGRRTKTSGSTLTTSYRYDSVGNLVEQVTHGESEIAFSYAYDRNGYITGEIRRENGRTVVSSYAYDAAGQLMEFLQTTGYGERYAYDKAGNMTEKVLTGTDGAETTLVMKYNKGNQLTGMVNGRDKIAYKYDRNGSMVEKALSSRSYGKLTDSYAYNVLDQLTEYVGYDGYRQAFTYDANGMRQSRSEAGDANRSTLEELLRGNIAGLPEIVEPTQSQTSADKAGVPEKLKWATTEYLYDLTQEYYQVISETTTYANGTSVTTAYAYGLERIAAYHENGVTRYVYDGRGSVAQAVNVSVAGEAVSSNLPDVGVQVQTFSYTAYGEQMGDVKVSGFTYNAEAYDAATGMLNLRARQYEPAVGRFGQKDIVRGQAGVPLSLNRYVYSFNSAPNCEDPNGLKAKETTYDKFKLEKKKGSAISGYYQLKVGTYLATVMGSQLTSVKSLKEARSQAKRIVAERITNTVSMVARKYIKAVEEADNFSEAQERADKAVEFMNEYKAYLEPGLQARLKALTTKEKKVKGSKTEKREGVSIARITMCMQLLYDEGVIKTADEAINTYSRLTKDSVLTKTTEEFLDTAAKLEGKPYSEVDCAGLIAQALKKYASYTGMTQMYKNDQVIGGTITSIDQLKALPVGTIVGQMNGSAGSQTATLESGAVVEHGGIVVMHDFGDGKLEKAIYQSRGSTLGGPAYTRIKELGLWNIWFWHDGVTN